MGSLIRTEQVQEFSVRPRFDEFIQSGSPLVLAFDRLAARILFATGEFRAINRMHAQ